MMEEAWKSTDEWAALEGVSGKDGEALGAVGMGTVGELLDWFPRRYEDRRHFDAFPAAAGAGAAAGGAGAAGWAAGWVTGVGAGGAGESG